MAKHVYNKSSPRCSFSPPVTCWFCFLEAKNQLFRIVWVVFVLKYSISFFLARLLSFYDVSCRRNALTLKICRSLPRDITWAKLVAVDRNFSFYYSYLNKLLFRRFLFNVDDESAKWFFPPMFFQLAKDLLHPTPEEEKRRHKKKRLVQCPNSYFMDVKCPGTLSYNKIQQKKTKAHRHCDSSFMMA